MSRGLSNLQAMISILHTLIPMSNDDKTQIKQREPNKKIFQKFSLIFTHISVLSYYG